MFIFRFLLIGMFCLLVIASSGIWEGATILGKGIVLITIGAVAFIITVLSEILTDRKKD